MRISNKRVRRLSVMTAKATSKASLREEKENGNVMSQEDKILGIISIGGDWSLKEIKAAYIAKWGDIETSSVSARCNTLKGDEYRNIPAKIFEVGTRKCSISGKVINCLAVERQKGLGEYQAWVEGGKTKDEQLARYNSAPNHMKKQIASHMKTVIQLRGNKNVR